MACVKNERIGHPVVLRPFRTFYFLHRIVCYQAVDAGAKCQSDAGLQRIDEMSWIIKNSVLRSRNMLEFSLTVLTEVNGL